MTRRVLLLAATAAFAACSRAPQAAGPVRAPVAVRLVAAGTASLPTKVAVSGVLAAQEELVVGLEVAGRLATLPVDVGDVVAVDAVLATLAPREFELEIARAEASLAAAEAKLGVARGADFEQFDLEAVPSVREANAVVTEASLHRDRIATMVQGQINSGSDLETAAAALAVAESRLQRARDEVRTTIAETRLQRIELQLAQKRLADSTVEAPWAGRVAQRHVVAGQVLAAGAPVVTLLRVDPLRLRLRVPDRLAMGVVVGQTVEFTVDGDAAATPHQGTIVRAGPAIDRGDRTRLVEAEVANANGTLLPGAFCRAQIVTAAAVPVVTVPKAAVVTFAGVHRVFTVGPPAANRRPAGGAPAAAAPPAAAPPPAATPATVAQGRIVQIGRQVGDQVEVVKGLDAGTRIVADAVGLDPESSVTVVE
jgi:RND family efflux transporter MFP subunit